MGRLDLIGRRFTLRRGLVLFNGGSAIDPALDVMFARETDDLEARVLISGTATAPEINFASTPSLPEQEVLPRALFGQSKLSLSALEAAQLASGVATLMSGEAGLLDRAREVTGLDVLDYGEVEGGADAVTAGRYVGEGVFVGAKQPLDGAGGSAIVEVEVLDGVSVDAEVDRDGGSSVGATWRYDF
ncbi:MAG: translocation/assembly module TamB domain-containing protein [Pseudomonadota bacterium]